MENLAIPGAGAIITKEINGEVCVLVQQRTKKHHEGQEDILGMLEIPAGKIRAFESVYNCLRREVTEETGLKVTYIEGEDTATTIINGDFIALSYSPFSSTQSIQGDYPVMVQVFICQAVGEINSQTSECRNASWISPEELQGKLNNEQHLFYPMHVTTLLKFLERKSKNASR